MFNLSNWVISLIRTYVPLWVGAGVVIVQGYLSDHQILWITIDSQQAAAWATGIAVSLYYLVARLLERKWPKLGGILLGHTGKPVYVTPPVEAAVAGADAAPALPDGTIMPDTPDLK